MKKVVSKRQLLPVLLSLCACLVSSNAMADSSAVEDKSLSAQQDTNCSKEFLSMYFPEVFVKETFTKFNVPKDKWDALIKGLNEKDKNREVIKLVEEKASKMTPNPLKDPSARHAAVKLFKETLLEIFSGVLKANGVTDDTQILSMLDDIQQQKAKHFALCIKRDVEANKDLADDKDDNDEDEEDDNDDDEEDDNDDDDKFEEKKSDNSEVKK